MIKYNASGLREQIINTLNFSNTQMQDILSRTGYTPEQINDVLNGTENTNNGKGATIVEDNSAPL